MRRILAALLLLTLLAGLGACGKNKGEGIEISATVAASGSDIAPVATAPASGTDASVNTAAYDVAKKYIGRPVDELLSAVGQPDRTQYAASCLEENAQDGMLFFDAAGFYAWTVKNAAGETVHDIVLNQ